ncbi:hypothetical protein AB0G79_00035 [Streptomyces sp. NPDC020807]|uniref:hypothetical protein n=1 Tax=Streptomyces sp. NPDC020807 TaxID=3155119 RepID=UPI0033D2F1B0
MKLHVTRLQDAVRRMVEDIGPYWAPGSADTHAATQAAALEQLVGGGGAEPDEVKKHLVEITVAIVALANTYGVSLQQAFNDASLPVDLTEASLWAGKPVAPEETAVRVAEAFAPVRDTMAFYRSDARKGSDPGVVALRHSVPGLLTAAFAGFDSADDLAEHLFRHFDSRRRPDVPVASDEFDPSRAESTGIMRPIQMETFCPFAQKSTLWGPPSYDESLSFEENMRNSLPSVRQYIRVLGTDVVDGYVYAFPTHIFGDSFDDLQQLFRNFVEFLHRTMTANAPAGMDPAVVTDPKWFLILEGEECFISVFAPCYPHDHSRYMNGVEGYFLFMLQPEAAVLRQLTKSDYHPRSEAIRFRFRDGFQEYTLADIEIDRFLLPMRPDEPPVKWYELNPTI